MAVQGLRLGGRLVRLSGRALALALLVVQTATIALSSVSGAVEWRAESVP